MGNHEAFRLNVDRARCEGDGMCQQAAPELIHLDDNDEPMIDFDEVSSARKPLADAAVHAYPVAALNLSSTQTIP